MQPNMQQAHMSGTSENAIQQDSQLERILEQYNKAAPKKQKTMQALSLPFYKGVQLPPHLKWITVTSVNLVANLFYRKSPIICWQKR